MKPISIKPGMSVKRKIAGIFISVIFAPLFILFLLPVFFGIINPGNVFGIFLSLTFFSVWLFFPKLNRNRFFRILLKCLLVLFILCIIYAFILTLNMAFAAGKMPPPDLDDAVVVILSAKTIDGKPDVMLKGRLDAAIPYLKSHEDFKCIVSGGLGDGSNHSDAFVMHEYLKENGIDENRIIFEDKSRNTYENIAFSEKIITELALPKKIVIISDKFHVWRAVMTAEKLGYQTYTVACDTSFLVLPAYWVRELFAITRDLIFN